MEPILHSETGKDKASEEDLVNETIIKRMACEADHMAMANWPTWQLERSFEDGFQAYGCPSCGLPMSYIMCHCGNRIDRPKKNGGLIPAYCQKCHDENEVQRNHRRQ